ncbi:MAG: hypothetical protein MJY98_08055 [Fibrobacter sp.]|nr:hypothetical protein [Fibrobacter sp.]
MKYLNLFIGFSLALTAFVFAAEDNHSTRQRANSAYDELDDAISAKISKKFGRQNEGASSQKNKDRHDRYSQYEGKYPAKEAPSQSITSLPADFPTPTIMVLPSVSGKGTASLQVVANNPYAKAAMDGVNEYLTANRYSVKSLEGSDNLDKVIQIQNSLAGSDEDLAYLASLVLNADIYIKYSGSVDKRGIVSVELNAYESSTARLLGTQSATVDGLGRNSELDRQANLRTAAKKAMPGLESKIVSYWQDDYRKGFKYRVIMNIKGDYDDNQLEDIREDIRQNLKDSFKNVKGNSMTSKTIDLVVYSDSDDVQDVYSQIRKVVKPIAPVKMINSSKKLIIMDIN